MYYVGRNGRQSGPHSLDDLKSMAAAGNLSPGDLTWTDGMSEWKTVREALPELVALMSPAAPPPATVIPLSTETPTPSSSSSPEPAAPPPPAPAAASDQPTLAVGESVPTYMWQSVAMTLLCCPVTGVPAIVFASQVQSKQQVGDIAGALKASKNAKLWCWISVAAGLIMYVLTLIASVILISIVSHANH